MSFTVNDLKSFAQDYAKAWSSGSAESVGAHYAKTGKITINRGDPLVGRDAVIEMAAGFMAEFPDLNLTCDEVRCSGTHVLFAWTLDGHHADTKNYVIFSGWEEWELDDDMKVVCSLGWFDAEDYNRQTAGRGL
ncbi:MAG: nuclear transport factor 2 family protein [Roseibium sp.]